MTEEILKTVAVVGRPNVGKSTLFNRLAGKRIAIETPIAGTTRDRLFAEVDWQGYRFNLVDVAGLESKTKNDLDQVVQSNAEMAIAEADLVLFVVDWNDADSQVDRTIARALRKIDKPIILVVNKADNISRQKATEVFVRLGNYPIFPVSAISGSNTGNLLEEIVTQLKQVKSPVKTIAKKETADINLAIIGRPNVGKSTLLNSIIGAKRAIVSSEAGTTRDIIDVLFYHKGKKILISDTAGIRRPGKIDHDSIESYSLLRTYQALKDSDVAVLIIDAVEGLVALDANILGKAKEWGKGIVLAVNKIDQVEDEDYMPRMLSYLRKKLNFAPWLSVVFISAQDEVNLKPLLDQVVAAFESRKTEIPEAELVKILEDLKNSNPQLDCVKSLLQKKASPPVFAITYKGRKAPHVTQVRYIENRLRDSYPMNGSPIFIDVN